MADLTTPTGLVAFLASTPYAATEVQILSGGTSGFTYRVTLQKPLETGQTTVVVKHCLGYLSSDAGFMLDVQRMDFEHKAMRMMNAVSFSQSVRVPRVWWYHPETHTLVVEDCAPARTLSAELVECLKRGDHARIEKLGEVLGDFTGKFHAWGAEPAQAPLRAQFLENVTSRDAVAKIRWQLMQVTANKYGMERAWMDDMMEESLRNARAGGPVIAMADLWFDNILVSESEELGVYIIDWEMARCARPEWDVAHFACAAYSCVHVYPGLGPELMRAFFRAYAAHAQLDLVQMGINAGRDVMSFGVMMPWVRHTDDSVKKPLAEIGLELLEAAHNSNTEALRQNPVLCDFV